MSKTERTPKLSKSVLNIPGTKTDLLNAQLLISSGIQSLDELLGDGFPVGTLIIIEEDASGIYSKICLKYFFAEGIANNHSLFVASQDVGTNKLIEEVPSIVEVDTETKRDVTSDRKMKIAFRYQNLPTVEKQKVAHFNNIFDLTKPISEEVIKNANITYWKLNSDLKSNEFSNVAYKDLLNSIRSKISDGKFSVQDKPEKRSILRVGIHSLGSPLWHNSDQSEGQHDADLIRFIYSFRALLRSAFAVGVVTVPSQLLNKECLDRCIHSSDIVIRLQSFSGTELENNPVLSNYHGYFHLDKVAAINSFSSKHPGTVECSYVFKLRRKKFYIEKLHLPPALEDINPTGASGMGCASNNKHLDF